MADQKVRELRDEIERLKAKLVASPVQNPEGLVLLRVLLRPPLERVALGERCFSDSRSFSRPSHLARTRGRAEAWASRSARRDVLRIRNMVILSNGLVVDGRGRG
ncbi:hypothetical protein ABT282_29150 [Streptomyces sp. NPDC000927]|uniref:hypothetical protein n=1 Tax=Streptomyces sp. NPDC000927 TaxID=3154371 RepID=UPI00333420CD